MIVTCPSCRTRYNHPHTEPDPSAECQCSRCASVFLPASLPRRYRIVAAGKAVGKPPSASGVVVAAAGPVPVSTRPGPSMTIGMDDPSLAGKLEDNGLNRTEGVERPVLSYSVVADEGAVTAERSATAAGDSLPEIWLSLETSGGRTPLAPVVLPSASDPDRAETRAEAEEEAPAPDPDVEPDRGEETTAEAPRKTRVGLLFLGLLLVGGLSAGGWFLAPWLGDNPWVANHAWVADNPWIVDPRILAAAGGGLGLLLSGVMWRWSSRKH